MAMYVDVETSPEALQDDVELMEAVHELVLNISTVAQAELTNEVLDFFAYLNERLEHFLPILYVYQREPQRLQDDCERLLLFSCLVATAVWFLGPKRQTSALHNASSTSSASLSPHGTAHTTATGTSGSNQSNSWFASWRSSSRLVNDEEDDDDDELLRLPHEESYHSNDDFPSSTTTDEERFELMYTGSILHSGYGKLVLPPTCRRILITNSSSSNNNNNNSSRLQRHSSHTSTLSTSVNNTPLRTTSEADADDSTQSNTGMSTNDDDNPVARLQYYLRQLWLFNRSLLRFDYMTAGSTLWHWMASLQRLRQHDNISNIHSNSTSNLLTETATSAADMHGGDTTSLDDDTTAPSATCILGDTKVTPCTPQMKTTNTTDATDTAENDSIDALPRTRIEADDSFLCSSKHFEIDENKDDSHPCDDENKPTMSGIIERKVIPSVPPSVKFSDQAPTLPSNKSIPLETNGRHQSGESVYFDSPRCVEENDFGLKGDSSCEDDPAQTSHNSTPCRLTPLTATESEVDASATEITWLDSRRTDISINSSFGETEDYAVGNLPLDLNDIPTIDWDTTKTSTVDDSSLMEDEVHDSTILQPLHLPTRKQMMLQSLSKRRNGSTSSPSSSSRHYFDAAQTHLSIHKMSVDCPMPDKNGYLLGDSFLPDSTRYTPLLVFVNSRSGPQQGPLLIAQLRRLLNPIQVWDLADGGPRSILESFLVFSRLRLLVCGGDGTVSWIVQTLEDMKIHDQRQYPPIAILPLGTGNDLARIHGWGGGYNYESLITILEQISESYSSLLDRWEVVIHEGKNKKTKEVKGFFNYLGVGADAQAALQVHYLRESRPEWFFSRVINKAMYGLFGAEDIIKATTVNVRREIKLIADGVEVPLPPDSQGIILLNIDAYAGGVPLWSHGVRPRDVSAASSPRRSRSMSEVEQSCTRLGRFDRVESVDELQHITSTEERFAHVTSCDMPSSCQDGYLDVVSIRGAFHLGQIKVGLSNAQRLCQCREATIVIRNKVAVQVDGEPWRQNTCQLTIKRKKDPAVMLHRSADDGGVETEMSKLLDWAEARNMIDNQVHSILMKEFSRRIESKKRQRRVRQSDNIMSTLKKAMSSGAMTSNLSGSGHTNWQGGGGIAF